MTAAAVPLRGAGPALAHGAGARLGGASGSRTAGGVSVPRASPGLEDVLEGLGIEAWAGDRCVGMLLTAEEAQAADLRRSARSVLAVWGLADLEWDVTLLVTELFANAVQHTSGPNVLVSLACEAGGLRISVTDGDPKWCPAIREQPDDAGEQESGRGLALVGDVAADWGVEVMPRFSCKTVWALALPPSPS